MERMHQKDPLSRLSGRGLKDVCLHNRTSTPGSTGRHKRPRRAVSAGNRDSTVSPAQGSYPGPPGPSQPTDAREALRADLLDLSPDMPDLFRTCRTCPCTCRITLRPAWRVRSATRCLQNVMTTRRMGIS